MRYYDLTLPIGCDTPRWPGDPAVRVRCVQALARGDAANVRAISLGTHTGTHVDAPAHLLAHGADLDGVPLEALLGPAHVVALPGAREIAPQHLEALQLPADCRRLLVRTDNSERGLMTSGPFVPDYAALTGEAGAWLAESGVCFLGIDALSVDLYHAVALPAHHALLARGVVIAEGLDLRAVPAGRYELVCLPLRLTGADGAPARIILVAP